MVVPLEDNGPKAEVLHLELCGRRGSGICANERKEKKVIKRQKAIRKQYYAPDGSLPQSNACTRFHSLPQSSACIMTSHSADKRATHKAM